MNHPYPHADVLARARAGHPSLAITGLANYSPGPAVGNEELEDVLQAPVRSLMSYFGVQTRHYAIDPRTGEPREPGLGTSEMSARAGRAALAQAGLAPAQVDTLVCATSTPDGRLPPLTHAVQQKLGLGDIALFDLRGGCAVALQGLSLAAALIESGRARRVLVTLADTVSRYYLTPLLGRSDPRSDPRTEDLINATTFADGAAAVVVEAAAQAQAGALGFELLSLSARSCFADRAHGFGVDGQGQSVHNHRAIREHLPVVMQTAVAELQAAQASHSLDALGQPAAEIGKLIVPQVNRSMLDLVQSELHDKVFYVGDRIGNCPAPAILRALALGVEAGEIVPGHTRVGVIAIETASWSYGTALLN